MILVLTLLYVGILLLAFRKKWVPKTLFWKLSPIFWVVLLLVILFFPLQFWSPTGYLRVMQPTVQIIPNVAGPVVEVLVGPNQHVKKGDILYRIDDRPFRDTVKRLQAELKLAQIRYEQQFELVKKGVGRKVDLDRTRAGLDSAEAALSRAEYDLEQTVVRAPADGIVTNVEALRPGARVVKAPVQQTMTFVEDNKWVVFAQIHQIYMRYIEPGQKAEIAFKKYPGKVYPATVETVMPGTALGQFSPTGNLPAAVQEVHGPQFVRLVIDDQDIEQMLIAGDTGNVAIYTAEGKPVQVIRKVIIRSTAIMNYIIPF